MDQIQTLIDSGAWTALAALVVTLIARAAKENRLGGLFARVPVVHRPRVIAALGIVAGIFESVVRGVPWPRAIVGGILTGALAMWIHGVAGGVNPKPKPLEPGAIRVTAPPGSTVSVEAMLGDEGAPAAPPAVEPSTAWSPR